MKKEDENLTLSFAALFLILALIKQSPIYVLISLILILTRLFSTTLSKKISIPFLFIFSKIGEFMTYFILTLIFFLFLTPLSIFRRVVSKEKDPLKLKITNQPSYFITRNHEFNKDDFEKQW